MRLRNIPRADGVIDAHRAVIKKPEEQRGQWAQVFGNEKPIQIEIGMGKGQFILNMAKAHPEINFIGIERYSSVLLRALEKYDTEEFENLENIRFICMDAREIENVFAPSVVSPPCARRSAWNKSTIIPSKDIIDGPKRIAPSPVPVGCEQLPVTEGIFSDERMKTKAPASARSIFVLLFFFACFCILIPPAIRNGIHTTPHIIQ